MIAFADGIGVIAEWCVGGRCTLGPACVRTLRTLVMAGSAGFVRDLVLRAGTVGLTASLAAAFRRLRFLIAFADGIGVIAEWCVGGSCALGPACVSTLGTGCIISVIYCVLRWSSLLVAGCTLGAAGVYFVLGWGDA